MSAVRVANPPAARWQRLLLKWRGQVWLLLGSPTRAMEAFDDMLALDPRDTYALASRAHLRAQRGERRAAIDDLRAMLAVDAGSAANWFNLGFLLEQDGALAEAETALRRATELDERNDRAWYGLGLVLIRQQRFDEAVVALETNTRLQPMSPHGWYQLARVHVDRGQPESAARVIRHLRGFEPKVAAQLERETGLGAAPPGS